MNFFIQKEENRLNLKMKKNLILRKMYYVSNKRETVPLVYLDNVRKRPVSYF